MHTPQNDTKTPLVKVDGMIDDGTNLGECGLLLLGYFPLHYTSPFFPELDNTHDAQVLRHP